MRVLAHALGGRDPRLAVVESVELRVEELAAAAGVRVDTVRYYQAKGLLPPPRRAGRVALYDERHLERLRRVKALQAKGLSLAVIQRVLDGGLDPADEALLGAVSDRGAPDETLMDLEDLARRTGIPEALLQAVVAEGLLVPVRRAGQSGYTEQDASAARAGLTLLSFGLPLSELLGLAGRHHEHVVELCERAVALFDEHVRTPLRADPSLSPEEQASRLVAAFEALLPAVTTLVAHHFARVLLDRATRHLEAVGSAPERAAAGRVRP